MYTNTTVTLYFGWSSEVWGFLSSAIAAVFLGTYHVPFKPRVFQKIKPDPMIVQIFMSVGIFVSSWLILIFVSNVTFEFTPLGVVSASLWLTSNIFGIFGKNTIGRGVTQGIAASCTIVVSFLWGHFILEENFNNFPLSVLGIVFLVAGIAGITFSGSDFLDRFFSEGDDDSGFFVSSSENERLNPYAPSRKNSMRQKPDDSILGAHTLIGTTAALLQGITHATMLVPMYYLSNPGEKLIFLASFGVGVIIITPIFAIFYFIILYRCFKQTIEIKLRLTSVAGIFSGLFWNIGNWGTIYATLFLGLACGWPLSHTHLVINSIWKLIFKEIQGVKHIGLLLFSIGILIGGASLLASNAILPHF